MTEGLVAGRDPGGYVAALAAALELQVATCADLDPTAPSRCDGWTVGDVLAHSIATTEKLTRFAIGETDSPRTLPPVLDLEAAAAASTRAWAAADLGRTCRLPFAVLTADLAAGLNLVDVLAHTWDVAPAVRAPAALWTAAHAAAQTVLGAEHDPAHYAAPVAPERGDGPREAFLKGLGRRP